MGLNQNSNFLQMAYPIELNLVIESREKEGRLHVITFLEKKR